MGQDLIQRWISDFTVFSSIQNSPEKLNAFAGDVVNNHDLKTALFNCLDDLRSHERVGIFLNVFVSIEKNGFH